MSPPAPPPRLSAARLATFRSALDPPGASPVGVIWRAGGVVETVLAFPATIPAPVGLAAHAAEMRRGLD